MELSKEKVKIILFVEYEIGDEVILKTDEEKLTRIVTGYSVGQQTIVYRLACGVNETTHYDFEIIDKENKII